MTSREEVAGKLRESGKWLDSGDTASIREAFYLIEQNAEAPRGREFAPFFDRLANLIAPTCKPIEADNNIVCSECGADLYDGDLYCPHCGARVVRGLGALEQVALPADGYIDNQILALAT